MTPQMIYVSWHLPKQPLSHHTQWEQQFIQSFLCMSIGINRFSEEGRAAAKTDLLVFWSLKDWNNFRSSQEDGEHHGGRKVENLNLKTFLYPQYALSFFELLLNKLHVCWYRSNRVIDFFSFRLFWRLVEQLFAINWVILKKLMIEFQVSRIIIKRETIV